MNSDLPVDSPVVIGIESGGTKLQAAVSHVEAPDRIRIRLHRPIERLEGASGILAQLESMLSPLVERFDVKAFGYGFGGPVDIASGRVITSHQVDGWDEYPLVEWFLKRWSVPVYLGNDCNVAALAEARQGAGRGFRRILYVTVGTGIGGGLIVDGRIDGEQAPAIAEIGHLRPGLDALSDSDTVESIASGLGIENRARAAIERSKDSHAKPNDVSEFAAQAGPNPTSQRIAELAAQGSEFATSLLLDATTTLGWAIAQATTLSAPEHVVIGGGVGLGVTNFVNDVRRAWERYCFRPHREYCEIVPAELGEQVVLHGAIQLAADRLST